MLPKLLRPSEKMFPGHSVAIFLILTVLTSTFSLAHAQQAPLPASGKVNGKVAFEEFPLVGGSQARNIYTIEPDGSNKSLILEGSSSNTELLYYSVPSYSPDGTKIALERSLANTGGTEYQIY